MKRFLGWCLTGLLSVVSASAAPVFTTHPAARTVLAVGERLELRAEATGTGAPTYQWKHQGRAIAGATQPTYAVPAVTWSDAGDYVVEATDDSGVAERAVAWVNIAPAWPVVTTLGGGAETIPDGLDDVVAVAGSASYGLALRRDGTLAEWGQGFVPMMLQVPGAVAALAPKGLGNVAAITVGGNFGAALQADGTVVTWGTYGWVGYLEEHWVTEKAVAIDAVGSELWVRTAAGGLIRYGTLFSGTQDYGAGVRAAQGGELTLLLTAEGQVRALGWLSGSYATPEGIKLHCPVPADLGDVVEVAVGQAALALRRDGTVYAWRQISPTAPMETATGLTGIVALAVVGEVSYGVRADGTVLAWSGLDLAAAQPVAGLSQVLSLSGGALVLRTGAGDPAPVITAPPVNQVVVVGSPATLQVSVSGAGVRFQWYKEGVAIPGAEARKLTLDVAQPGDAGSYHVEAYTAGGRVRSDAVQLVVTPLPVVPATVGGRVPLVVGEPLHLTVTPPGSGGAIRWKKDGRLLATATAAELTLPAVSLLDQGCYLAEVSDAQGAIARTFWFVLVEPKSPHVYWWAANDPVERAAEPPSMYAGVAALATGTGRRLLLHGDGTVTDADPTVSAQEIPAGLANVVALSAFEEHVLALRADGTVVHWGGAGSVPEGLAGVMAVAAGRAHFLALRVDGTVLAWGANQVGQCQVPAGLTEVVAVAATAEASVALKADGTLVVWGQQAAVPAEIAAVRCLAPAARQVLAFKEDGQGWVGGAVSWDSESLVTSAPVVAVAWTTDGDFALQADGHLAHTSYAAASLQARLAQLDHVAQIAADTRQAAVLRDGSADAPPTANLADLEVTLGCPATFTVQATGPFLSYQWRKAGTPIPGETGATLTLAQTQPGDAGRYEVTVTNYAGAKTCAATLTLYPAPAIVTAPASWARPAVGAAVTLTVEATGVGPLQYQWWCDGRLIPGATTASHTVAADAARGLYAVAVTDARGAKACALTQVRRPLVLPQVLSWSTGGAYGPGGFPEGADIVDLAQGAAGAVAIRADGTLLFRDAVVSPALPLGVTEVVAVAVGAHHYVALRSDGSVVAWGDNAYGQTAVPARLGPAMAVAAGDQFSAALLTDGSVVAWGALAIVGQSNILSTGTVVADAATIIAAGGNCLLAGRSDGTVVAAGKTRIYTEGYFHGQYYHMPQDVAATLPRGAHDVVSLAATLGNVAAVNGDGSVVLGGDSYQGAGSWVPAGLGPVAAVTIIGNRVGVRRVDGSAASWRTEASLAEVPLAPVQTIAGDLILRDAGQDAPPQWTREPAGCRVTADIAVVLEGVATGNCLLYQWSKDGVPIPGATQARLRLAEPQASDSGHYTLEVNNARGRIQASADVTVSPALTVRLPAGARQVVAVGAEVALAAVVDDGQAPFTYRWKKNGLWLAGASRADLTVAVRDRQDAGCYAVEVTDARGVQGWAQAFVLLPVASPQIIEWGSVSWPTTEIGAIALPTDLRDIVAIDHGKFATPMMGGYYYCGWVHLAVRADGTVAAWGENSCGQLDVPTGLSDVVAVQVNGNQSLALKADGSVVVWGEGAEGARPVLSRLPKISRLTAGNGRAVAICANGQVRFFGFMGDELPTDLANVAALPAGGAAALLADGSVRTWGALAAYTPTATGPVQALDATREQVVVLHTDGTVAAWGQGGSFVPEGLIGVVDVRECQGSTLALRADGTPAQWPTGAVIADLPVGLDPIVAIDAREGSFFALREVRDGGAAPVLIGPWAVGKRVVGTAVQFSVVPVASGTVTYQWQRRRAGATVWENLLEDSQFSGVQTAQLTLQAVLPQMAGDEFRCVVADGVHPAVASHAGQLAVLWSQFAALSARAPVGAGDQTLILGFVFAGGGKPTLVRGVGPGLLKGDPNLAGQELVDPVLTLNELQTVNNVTQFVAIATNDNWGGTEELRTKMSALGMGALDDTSADAVMLTTPTRAVYTAQISGANQTTGLALAEAYDAHFADKTRRFTALSMRNQVGVGADILIAGLVITGDAPKKVIIRGVGPGLVPTVAASLVLANPTLQLNQLNTATMTWSVVGANDDWGGAADLATAMSQAGMGALAADSKDAVLLLELQPGIYTAQLSGVGDTTGIGLVEIYEAP